MAYRNLYTPLSQFVDPMSTEIGDMLRERYLTNYQASSAVEQEMANLTAAPFEGDKKLRDGLVNDTQMQLKNVAERGDYENMTLPVMNAAKRYNMESAPIKQNYELYNAYQTQLKEDYNKKDIDYEDYQGNLDLSTYDYSGLQRDAQGKYSNPFNGLTPIKNPKIEERIKNALNGIVAEEFNVANQDVGLIGSDGVYTVKTEKGYKTVSADRVQQVMDMVMSDSQVQSYINRKAEIRYKMADAETLEEKRQHQLGVFSSQFEQYQEAAANTTNSDEKAAYEAAAANEIEKAGALQSIADYDKLRAYMQATEAANIETTYRQGAQARYSYQSQTKDSKIIDWDKKYLKTLEASGALSGQVAVTVPGALQQVVSPSGTTITSKHSSNAKTKQALTAMQQPGYFDELAPELTFDQVVQMSTADFTALDGGQSTPERIALFNRMKSGATEMLAQQYAINKVVEEAGAATGETVQSRTERALQIEALTPLVNHFKQKYNVEDPEALNMVRYFLNEEEMYDASPLKNAAGAKRRTFTALDEILGFAFGYDTSLLDESAQLYPNLYQDNAVELATLSNVANWEDAHEDVRETLMESDKILNAYLKDPTIRQFTPTITPKIPGMSKTEMDQINTIFQQTNPFAQGTAFVSKRTGQLVSFDQFVSEEADLNITPETAIKSTGKVMFNPANAGPQGATLQVTYEVGKDKTQVTAQVPISQVTGSPGLNNYLGSLSSSFYRQALIQRNHGVQTPLVTAVLPPGVNPDAPEGTKLTFEVDVEEGTITPKNGPSAGKPMDMNTALGENGLLSILQAQQFSHIVPGE
tara:strand:- start:257 stop:2695 length:2439 start_codon:yes stop_codon:yes gene_type:complete